MRGMRLSWRDARVRAVLWQMLILAALAWGVWLVIGNTGRNLAARHIATGFGFLGQAAPIPIGETPIAYEPSVSTYARALLIGLLNTLKVSVVGIVLATVLGVVVGIARLSGNFLAARLSAAYVELLRDTPPLLQLLVWYGLLQTLPPPRQALQPLPGVFLTNRGLLLPGLEWQPAHSAALGGLLLGGVLLFALRRRARLAVAAPLLLVALPLAAWAALGAPFSWQVPVLHGFNFQGGLALTPEYAALLIGLSIYTSAYIAEIVRSGIQAVAKGQWEAAVALGLTRGQTLRLVVLPQALRVIIPPLTSEYLNLAKNSSLAVAIGYQDLVSVADTTLNQTGQSIESIAIVMAVFLAISLSISAFMNWYNAHVALVER